MSQRFNEGRFGGIQRKLEWEKESEQDRSQSQMHDKYPSYSNDWTRTYQMPERNLGPHDDDWHRLVLKHREFERDLRDDRVGQMFHGRKWNPNQQHGVYLFISFPGYKTEYVAQTVVLARRTVFCSRGTFKGIAKKVIDLSTIKGEAKGLVVYHFESSDKAEEFFKTNDRMKQPDFPPPAGTCRAWTVVQYIDPVDEHAYPTYMMCETSLKEPCREAYEYYKKHFVPAFADLVMKYKGQPFIVQSIGVHTLKGPYTDDNTIVTVHLFPDESQVSAMMEDKNYIDLKKFQLSMASDVTSVFTIDHQACP